MPLLNTPDYYARGRGTAFEEALPVNYPLLKGFFIKHGKGGDYEYHTECNQG